MYTTHLLTVQLEEPHPVNTQVHVSVLNGLIDVIAGQKERVGLNRNVDVLTCVYFMVAFPEFVSKS